MWPIDQISGLMWRLKRPRTPDLVVDAQGFSLCKSGEIIERYAWDEVDRIVAFKRDLGVYDEICLQIDIGRRVGPLILTEEYGNFQSFVDAFVKYLPCANQEWWFKVAFPAFAENATVVFMRSS